MTHLHVHTEFSMLDSIIKIPELIKKIKNDDQKAVAITDHGNLGGIYEFWKECNKNDIKPIIGCEFYHEKNNENYHLIILAKNKIGFNNLVNLNNEAVNNYYKKPRINDEMIKKYSEGLIGMTACIGGYFPQTVVNDNPDWHWYKEMIGIFNGDFYLEIQRNGIKDQDIVTDYILKSGLPCVATVDAHYLNKNDKFAHEVALGIMTNKRIDDPKAFKFDGCGYYIKTESEMLNEFPKESIELSDEIADSIENYNIGYEEWQLPSVEVDFNIEYAKLFNKLQLKNLDNNKEYVDRLKYEFEVIKDNGFLSYFVIISDLCKYFDNKGIFRGWGRGSVSGSLVSFLYGITKIDPIEWDLYFERFLNPDRITPPDIDLDFMPDSRNKAIRYFKEKYGDVYQISTYGTLNTKEVIKTTARIMGIHTSLDEFVPAEAPIPTVKELIEKSKPFVNQINKEGNEDFIKIVLRLEGLKRNLSIHAAGIVISDGNIPLRINRTGINKGIKSTTWDMYTLEGLKYVKFDILGVKNLELIDSVIKKVGIKVDDIPLDDEKTYKLICDCNTTGVFQWESSGYKDIIKRLHPDNFDELLDLNTLYRPGCLESGITDEYIERKFGRRPIIQLHPLLNMNRFGLPLYQEDIMKMSVDLAGFTLPQADKLRKAIGKKEKETFKEIKDMFVNGCKFNMSENEALDMWDKIEKFARYTWNKAHSVAYTLISWWTAYLSTHYTAYFLCELLNKSDSADRRRILLSECRRRKIKVKYPDINKSGAEFNVIDGDILVGLSGIRFIGEKTLDKIMKERTFGDFSNIEDFKNRTRTNKRAVESLCNAGAFGEDLKGGLKEESESLGYCISKRLIDQVWWSKYAPQIGEVIGIHKITTKKGDPMAFISVEHQENINSITVFPGEWRYLHDVLIKGCVGLFEIDGRNVLSRFIGINEYNKLKLIVKDPEGFLSFRPSNIGIPNIFAYNLGISSIDLDEKIMLFIDENFGIEKVLIN